MDINSLPEGNFLLKAQKMNTRAHNFYSNELIGFYSVPVLLSPDLFIFKPGGAVVSVFIYRSKQDITVVKTITKK